MKITGVESLSVGLPVKIPFSASILSFETVKTYVIARVHTDEGTVGIGEAAPEPRFSDESLEGAARSIDTYIGPAILGEDPANLEGILEKIHGTLVGNPVALSAIDFALYDLLGKKTGQPVCKLIGGLYRETVPVVWVLSLRVKADEIAKEAVDYVQKGFETLKLKIGLDPEEDLIRVKAVRDAVGEEAKIRVDANAAWTPDKAVELIRRLERYDLELAEQPVAGWDLEGMVKVAKAIDTPIMADESLFSPSDAIRIVKMEAADVFNIKIMKPGGIYNSNKIAAIAEAANVPCVVGSMLETGIGTAASTHFAGAHRVVKYACEMIGPMYFGPDIVKEDLTPKHGQIAVPTKPGLGVELDDRRIRDLKLGRRM